MGEGVFLGGDFVDDVSVGEVAFLVEDDGGVLISEVDEDLGGEVDRETDGRFGGEGGVDDSSSSMVVWPTSGKSSMTSGSS